MFPCNFVEFVEDKSTPPPVDRTPSRQSVNGPTVFGNGRASRESTPDNMNMTVRDRKSVSPRPDSPWNGMRYSGDAETIKSLARSSFLRESERDNNNHPKSRTDYKSRDAILQDITAELSRGSSSISRFSSIASSANFQVNNRVEDMTSNNGYYEGINDDYSDSSSDESYAPSFIPSRGNSLLQVKQHQLDSYDHEAYIYPVDNSYRQPSRNSYHSTDGSYQSSQDSYDEYDDNDYEDKQAFDEMPNTPPLPPRHSVPVDQSFSRTNSMNSTASTPPPTSSNRSSLNLDRTPSPLRNAMDDVLESLDNMGDLSRSSSFMSSLEDDLSATITKSTRSKMTNSRSGSNVRKSLDKRFSQLSVNNQHSQLYTTQDDDEGYIPFDPTSYNNIATTNSHTQPEWPISRADTYRSTNSSINTNSLSIISHSTTPTSVSNHSSSNGSMNHHNGNYVPVDSIVRANTNSTISTNSTSSVSGRMAEFIEDTPVKLPDANTNTISGKPLKSLKLRKSAGFIRNLFSSSPNKEDVSTDIDHGKIINSSSASLKRTKSHSSRKSISSTSSHLRNSFRRVSAKALSKASGGLSSSFNGNRSSNSHHQTTSWIEARRDIHRSNTITKNEADQRRLQLELHGVAIREPLKSLSLVAGNETLTGPSKGEGKRDIAKQDFTKVDESIAALTSWPKLMTPAVFASSRIGRQFEYDIERLRAVFDLCASKFTWEQALPHDDEDEDVSSFSRLMQTRKATSQELAYCVKSMCEALEIKCEVVKGHLKIPGENFDNMRVARLNHYWNAAVVDNEWRFLDVSLANPSFATRDCYYKTDMEAFSRSASSALRVNHFYFMTRPVDLIYTHVPCYTEDQFIVPPLRSEDALSLPIAGPELFKYDMKLIDFHTGLTKLNNLEIAELTLSVQHGIELLAEVVVGNMTDLEDCVKVPGLAQAYWENNRRYFRVKGYLPEPYSQGVLNIYVGERGSLQSINRNTLGLAYSIGITHSGENAPLEFLTRHPTPHCKRQDLYVKQPQCKKLLEGNSYAFSVRQHPAGGITSGSGFARTKLGIQSPSGRVTKMHITEGHGHVSGTWEASVKCAEVGTWRGLILADSGNAWSVFAEWYCT